MAKHLSIPILLFLLFFAGMTVVQFSTPHMPDNDGFYHIKFAWLMREEGLKPKFPYLPLSILNQEDYYDHHFLYHIFLIPFTFGDLRLGAKWSAVTFSALGFLAVWYLLERRKTTVAWLWALALLGISEAFLYRMSISRAQSLSLGVMALGITFMLEGRYKSLAALSFLYVWMYDAFPLMLAIATLYSAAVFLAEERLDLRPLLWVAIGIALGLIVNPYFPNNLIFTWHHLLPKLQFADSVKVGNEWYPYNTEQLIENSLPALLAFASGCLALGLAGRRMNTQTALAFLSTLLFGAMLFKARRFIEYFPAFTLIFAAIAWSDFFSGLSTAGTSDGGKVQFLKEKARSLAPAIILSILVIFGMITAIPAVQNQMAGSKPYDMYAGASAWLAQNTAEGEMIFQTDWDDFPRLFFYNTHNTYLAGLDPTYFEIYSPDLYREWVKITRGKVEDPSRFIRTDFNARFVHTDLEHDGFINQARKDPGMREVYRDDDSVVFEVIEP